MRRVSTDGQQKKGAIESQLAELRKQVTAADRKLVKEYIDDDSLEAAENVVPRKISARWQAAVSPGAFGKFPSPAEDVTNRRRDRIEIVAPMDARAIDIKKLRSLGAVHIRLPK